MKKSILITTVITLTLSACNNNGKLTREKAEEILRPHLNGEAIRSFDTVTFREDKDRHLAFQVLGERNLVKFNRTNDFGDIHMTPQKINHDEVAKQGLEHFLSEIPYSDGSGMDKINIYMYKYRLGEVTGIINEPNTDCGAKVEFIYEQYEKAPWADKYLEVTGLNRPYTRCFVKYDDGWRLKE